MKCTHENPCSDREPSECDNHVCPANAGNLNSSSTCSVPWHGKLHHSRNLCDDWGCIRDEAGDLIIKLILPTYDEDVLQKHRRNKTDPTQERVEYILAALNGHNSLLEESGQPNNKRKVKK